MLHYRALFLSAQSVLLTTENPTSFKMIRVATILFLLLIPNLFHFFHYFRSCSITRPFQPDHGVLPPQETDCSSSTMKFKMHKRHVSKQGVLLLMLKARTSMPTVNPAFNTPKTDLDIGGYTFTAAADSQAGANIIHSRVLEFLKSTNVKISFAPYDNFRLIVADERIINVKREALLSFSIPNISTQEYSLNFLIMENPHDIILSHTATKLSQNWPLPSRT